MSSTRSPSPKAPATSAVIVSHGQPSDPGPAEAALARFAAGVGRALPGWHVGAATLAAPGALTRAVAAAGGKPLIYPLFMTRGWFTSDALRLRAAGARVLPPFGCDPGLPRMAAALLRGTIDDNGWEAHTTRIFIAAHGSGRSPNAARDTRGFARALGAELAVADIRVGFVEEPPYLAETALGMGSRAICLPFFAAYGDHVTEDIPEALARAGFEGPCLDPVGCAPGATGMVARALRAARVAA